MNRSSMLFILLAIALALTAWSAWGDEHDGDRTGAVGPALDGDRLAALRRDEVDTDAPSLSRARPEGAAEQRGVGDEMARSESGDALGRLDALVNDPLPWSGSVLDLEDRPVADAVLSLLRVPRLGTVERGDLLEVVHSDEDGRFQGSQPLMPGRRYAVRAAHPGHLAALRRGIDVLHLGETGIEMRLAPRTDQLVMGIVKDAHGRSVEGARVRLARRGGEGALIDGVADPGERATTDGEGVFEVALPGGAGESYLVSVTAEGHASWSSAGPLAGSLLLAETLEVALAKEAILSGRIDGRIAGGARLIARPQGGETAHETPVSGGGTFRLRGLAAGPHRLEVRAGPRLLARGSAQAPDDAVLLRADSEPVVTGTLVVEGEGLAPGAVRFAWLALDDEGKPTGWLPALGEASEDGSFSVSNPDLPGTRVLFVRDGAGFSGRSTSLTFERDGGRDRQGIVVSLLPPGLVAGRVIDATTGAPIAGLRIRLAPAAPRGLGDAVAPTFAPHGAVTLSDGTWVANGLAPGFWVASFESGDLLPAKREILVGSGQRRSLGTVDVERGGGLSAQVRESDGRVASYARVAMGRRPGDPGARWFVCDDQGVFRVDAVAPGRWYFEAHGVRGTRTVGSAATGRWFEVRAGEAQKIQLTAR